MATVASCQQREKCTQPCIPVYNALWGKSTWNSLRDINCDTGPVKVMVLVRFGVEGVVYVAALEHNTAEHVILVDPVPSGTYISGIQVLWSGLRDRKVDGILTSVGSVISS